MASLLVGDSKNGAFPEVAARSHGLDQSRKLPFEIDKIREIETCGTGHRDARRSRSQPCADAGHGQKLANLEERQRDQELFDISAEPEGADLPKVQIEVGVILAATHSSRANGTLPNPLAVSPEDRCCRSDTATCRHVGVLSFDKRRERSGQTQATAGELLLCKKDTMKQCIRIEFQECLGELA